MQTMPWRSCANASARLRYISSRAINELQVKLTRKAEDDLLRLYDFILARNLERTGGFSA